VLAKWSVHANFGIHDARNRKGSVNKVKRATDEKKKKGSKKKKKGLHLGATRNKQHNSDGRKCTQTLGEAEKVGLKTRICESRTLVPGVCRKVFAKNEGKKKK